MRLILNRLSALWLLPLFAATWLSLAAVQTGPVNAVAPATPRAASALALPPKIGITTPTEHLHVAARAGQVVIGITPPGLPQGAPL